ncbi:MAG: hypothetical protein GY738_30780 [Pseudoalteromonas sp.]|nr:hypothetical protein [Pseudoalteromonas sp.]
MIDRILQHRLNDLALEQWIIKGNRRYITENYLKVIKRVTKRMFSDFISKNKINRSFITLDTKGKVKSKIDMLTVITEQIIFAALIELGLHRILNNAELRLIHYLTYQIYMFEYQPNKFIKSITPKIINVLYDDAHIKTAIKNHQDISEIKNPLVNLLVLCINTKINLNEISNYNDLLTMLTEFKEKTDITETFTKWIPDMRVSSIKAIRGLGININKRVMNKISFNPLAYISDVSYNNIKTSNNFEEFLDQMSSIDTEKSLHAVDI